MPDTYAENMAGEKLVFLFGDGETPTEGFTRTFAASGPIQGIVQVEINDEITTFGTDGIATDGEHEDNMWFVAKLGTQPQTALAVPASIGVTPSEWTSAHAMSGKGCFSLVVFENSKKNQFRGGVPTVRLVIDGLLGWDPLDVDSEVDDPATWTMMEDGPTWALNWAIGRWEGPVGDGRYGVPYLSKIVGGYGAALEAIDVDAHEAAAEIVRGYGWTISDVPTSAEDKHAVRERALQSAGCEPARICGMISVVCVAAPVASVMTVTNRDTAGDATVALQPSRLDRRNVGLPKFKSPDHRWEMTQLRKIGDPDWITDDKGRRATGNSYPAVPDKDQCAALDYLTLAHGRALQGEYPFLTHMMRVEPGQGFTWDEPQFLMVGLKVQVRRRAYDPMSGVAKIAFRAERDANYTEALAQVGITPSASGAYVPPPIYVEPPTDLIASVVDGVVTFGWRNPINDVFDFVNVFRGVSPTLGAATLIDWRAGATGASLNVPDEPGPALSVYYWAVAVDIYGNVSEPVALASPVFVSQRAGPNLLVAPSDFANAAWVGDNSSGTNPVVTTNTGVGPDGTTTADQIVFSRGSGFSRLAQTVTVANGVSHDFGVWLRASTGGASIALRLDNTETATLTLTTDWQYFSITQVSTSTTTLAQLILWASISGSPSSCTVEAASASLTAA